MSMPDHASLMAAMEATWPPAERAVVGGFVLRRGLGGGGRVSSASPVPGAETDIAAAEAGMRAWGQAPLFRIDPGMADLDAALAARGYQVTDRVPLFAGAVAALDDGADHTARVVRVPVDLALACDIWTACGVDPARRAVMARARLGCGLMVRLGDRPVGMGFVGVAGGIAMVHALAVLPAHRRQGAGRWILAGAARFGRESGADWLGLAVSAANAPAMALYARAGMVQVGTYHYRGL